MTSRFSSLVFTLFRNFVSLFNIFVVAFSQLLSRRGYKAVVINYFLGWSVKVNQYKSNNGSSQAGGITNIFQTQVSIDMYAGE
jgi:hypothetical protein